jgi:hypothetical protein
LAPNLRIALALTRPRNEKDWVYFYLIRRLIFCCFALGLTVDLAQALAPCPRKGRLICVPDGQASLMAIEGDVRRSRGVGFKPVSIGDELIAGDRLIVRRGAATVAMASYCQFAVQANSLVTFTRAEAGLCAHGLFTDDLGANAPGPQDGQRKPAPAGSPATWNLRAPPATGAVSSPPPPSPMDIVPRARPDTSGRSAPAADR